MHSPIRRLLLTGLITAAAAPVAARTLFADTGHNELGRWVNAEPEYRSSRIAVSVLSGRGRGVFPIFGEHVGGEAGEPYRIRVRNLTGRRILVVPSVDGVNAITGETAHPSQSGYIIAPRSDLVIDGWRKSMREAAQFVFSGKSKSYAQQTGRPDNVGVLGFAVFEEAPRVEIPRPSFSAESAKSSSRGGALAESAAPAAADLGTAHGDRTQSFARRGEFERTSSHPIELVSLYYASIEELEFKGIALRQTERPQPFPGYGFVPDPPRGR